MKLKVRLGVLAAGGGIAMLALAGGPALASTQHASSPVTGPEVLAGAIHGKAALANNPVIPLTLSGLVNTTDSSFSLGTGKSKTHTVKTPDGNLVVQITGTPTKSQTKNKTTCQEAFTQDQTFMVAGSKSTGSFAGASGPGAVQVSFSVTAPRFTSGPMKGQCNFKGQPQAKTAMASFLAGIVLTTG